VTDAPEASPRQEREALWKLLTEHDRDDGGYIKEPPSPSQQVERILAAGYVTPEAHAAVVADNERLLETLSEHGDDLDDLDAKRPTLPPCARHGRRDGMRRPRRSSKTPPGFRSQPHSASRRLCAASHRPHRRGTTVSDFPTSAELRALRAALAASQAEVERLREALTTLGDIRRARAALAASQP
jgi:hypothetical protein